MVKSYKTCYCILVLLDQSEKEKDVSGKQKALVWLGIAIGAYWIYKQPEGAADAVGGAFSAVGDAFGSVITFLSALFK